MQAITLVQRQLVQQHACRRVVSEPARLDQTGLLQVAHCLCGQDGVDPEQLTHPCRRGVLAQHRDTPRGQQHVPAAVQAGHHRLPEAAAGDDPVGAGGGILQYRGKQQGIATGDGVVVRRQPAGGCAIQPVAEELLDARPGQQREVQPFAVLLAQQLRSKERLEALGLLGLGEHDEHPRRGEPTDEVLDTEYRRGIGELDVIHADQHGSAFTELQQQGAQALRHPQPFGRRRLRIDGWRAAERLSVQQCRHSFSELGRQ